MVIVMMSLERSNQCMSTYVCLGLLILIVPTFPSTSEKHVNNIKYKFGNCGYYGHYLLAKIFSC
jgi:hypothetical protein